MEVYERLEATTALKDANIPTEQPLDELHVEEEAVPDETTDLTIPKQKKRLSLEDTRKLLEEEGSLKEQTEGSSNQYLLEIPCSFLSLFE